MIDDLRRQLGRRVALEFRMDAAFSICSPRGVARRQSRIEGWLASLYDDQVHITVSPVLPTLSKTPRARLATHPRSRHPVVLATRCLIPGQKPRTGPSTVASSVRAG